MTAAVADIHRSEPVEGVAAESVVHSVKQGEAWVVEKEVEAWQVGGDGSR